MTPPLWIILPFVCLLGCIALAPLLVPHQWEKHYPKAAIILSAITGSYYLLVLHEPLRIVESLHEYFSFICLIGSLFIVSGGIHIRVKGESTPFVNVLFLGIGAVLSNFIGTTGASMVLIRPYLRSNKYRLTAYHVIFFIFIVSNIGGSLTPIGDPPLYLGYLRGIPFTWTIVNLLPMWLVANGLLLIIFYFIDRKNFRRAPLEIQKKETGNETWHFDGLHNLYWLVIILGSLWIVKPIFLREALMIIAGVLSWWTTEKTVHDANRYSWKPLIEVAVLFFGIFVTMVPALDYLEHHAASLGIDTVSEYYWGSGVLSAVLDNAPTYLNFLTAALGSLTDSSAPEPQRLQHLLSAHPRHIIAISIGAVFFGACTYIGNGPNFMVKSIAESSGVRMPTFFGYILKYTLPVLIPVLILIGWLFMIENP